MACTDDQPGESMPEPLSVDVEGHIRTIRIAGSFISAFAVRD